MSTDRDVTQSVRSWLEDGVTRLPDNVLDAVLDELPTTPQRRATWWRARRLPQMNTTAKLATGAAAIVVVALLGIGFLLPGGPRIGAPEPTAIPTPTPTPIPIGSSDHQLGAGTYVTSPLAPSMRFTMTFPAGWRAFNNFTFLPSEDGSSEAPDGMAFGFFQVSGLYADPCFASGAPDVVVGPTVDDLANAFADQSAYEVTGSTDVTLGGYAGTLVDLQLPSDLGPTTCGYEDYVVWPGSPYAQGPGNLWHVWILDVEGIRIVVMASDFEGTSPDDRAELQGILDSLRIEP